MSPVNHPLPVPDPEDRGRGTTDYDPTYGGAAIMAVLPHGADQELVNRVRKALGTAVNNDDDPPVVVFSSVEVDEAEVEEEEEGRRYFLPPLIPILGKVAKEGIDLIARELREQQRREHAAARAHQAQVERDLKRAQAWREKNLV